MRRIVYLMLALFVSQSAAAGQEKDWRQMERRDVKEQVSRMALKNGLNKVADDPKGFTLSAVVRNGRITGWQARPRRGRALRVSTHEAEAYGDDKMPAGKLVLVCVEEKEVCYEVQRKP
jgi:hypothetical protein